jgi:hypothetical protein
MEEARLPFNAFGLRGLSLVQPDFVRVTVGASGASRADGINGTRGCRVAVCSVPGIDSDGPESGSKGEKNGGARDAVTSRSDPPSAQARRIEPVFPTWELGGDSPTDSQKLRRVRRPVKDKNGLTHK